MTPNMWMSEYGASDPRDVVGDLTGLPPIAIESLDNVQTYEDGRRSVDVTFTQGQQLARSRWYLKREDGYWKVDDAPALPIPKSANTVTVAVGMTEYSFALDHDTVVNPGVVILHGTNAGNEEQEIAVIKVPQGVDYVAAYEGTPQAGFNPRQDGDVIVDFQFAPGQVAAPGLVDLEPETYVLADFINAPDGQPNVRKGMITTLTIEAPSS
jgi:hypothetical protein